MKKYAIAALAIVALGAAIAWAQVISIPPPAGVSLIACVYNLTPPTLTTGQPAYAQCDSTGHLVAGGGGGGGAVTIADGADVAEGATANTACGTDAGTGCTTEQRLSRIATNLTTLNTTAASPANIAAATTGGCTGGVLLTAASNNSSSLKNAAGTLCELTWLNSSVTAADIRLYDTGSAPTCSSATGIVANYYVAGSAASPGATVSLGPFGKAFANGIGICVTGGNSNTDNSNAPTGVNINYSLK